MKDVVFRINDIRGEIGSDMHAHDFEIFAAAFVAYLEDHAPGIKAIALGRDGRVHSPAIFTHMVRAFQRAGVDVLDLGVCPTPVVQFMVQKLSLEVGVMVTASHNGPTYNGCKLFYRKRPIWGNEIQRLKEYYYRGAQVIAARPGTLFDYTDSVMRYVEWLTAEFSELRGLHRTMVFDCGSGATGMVLPALVEAMQWPHAQLLYTEVDGRFPYHEADPVILENMLDLIHAVKTAHAWCGFGFDGDGDRVGVVDATGALLSGDTLIALYAHDLLTRTPGAAIVYDAKCSDMVRLMVQKLGGVPVIAPSGHAHIRESMRNTRAVFGGELSCHFFFHDAYFGFDDGIYAALRCIALLERLAAPLDQFVAQFPRMYATLEWRIPYADVEKHALVEKCQQHVRAHIPHLELVMLDGMRMVTNDGWWLLRASNTQPAISMRCESSTSAGLQRIGALAHTVLSTHVAGWDRYVHPFETWISQACCPE